MDTLDWPIALIGAIPTAEGVPTGGGAMDALRHP